MSGPYNIVYADPAWTYKDKASAGKRGACHKYDTLTVEEIGLLNVPAIVDTNAALFLWATPPLLPYAERVMEAWDFTYKTIAFTWIKTTKHGKLHFGMGNWTRANPEHVLLGLRGKMKRQSASVHSVVMAPLAAHSVKPPIIRDKIVELLGDLPRCELFAREATPGWDVWGNEVDSAFELPMRRCIDEEPMDERQTTIFDMVGE